MHSRCNREHQKVLFQTIGGNNDLRLTRIAARIEKQQRLVHSTPAREGIINSMISRPE
jgi:hypothetical protein